MGMLIRYLINILYYPYGNIISILYIYTKLNPTQRSSHSSNWIDPNLIDSISNKQFILTDPLHLDQSSILLERSVLYMATATNPKNTATTPQGSPVASPPTHGYNLRSSPQASQNQALVGNVDQKRPQDRQSGTGGGQQATGPGTTPTRAVKKAPQRKSPLKPGLNRSARFTQSFDKALFRHCLEKGICCKHLYGTYHLNEQCKFKHVSNSEKEQLLSSFPSQH